MASAIRILVLAATLCASFSQAQRVLHSTPNEHVHCGDNSQLTASSLNVSITPDNRTITYAINGTNEFSGNATIGMSLFLNLYNEVFKSVLDPCSSTGFPEFCPSSPGNFSVMGSMEIPQSSLDRIPDDEYTDVDPQSIIFEFVMNNTATNKTVGCIQAPLTNDAQESSGNSSSIVGGGNITNGSNSTGGSGGDSGAGNSHVSWTLLLAGVLFMVFFNA